MWNACIRPLSERGVKLLDPQIQTQALLAKMVVRGLTPGNEPWKALLRYKIRIGRPLGDAKWPESPNWLFYSKGVRKNNHSTLVDACIKAFISVRGNLTTVEPGEAEGKLRQQLFGNPLIVEEENIPLGMGEKIGLHLWAKGGIGKVSDIWDVEREDWLSAKQIQEKLPRKGAVTEKGQLRRRKTLSYIPWDPRERKSVTERGGWVTGPGTERVALVARGTRVPIRTYMRLQIGLLREQEQTAALEGMQVRARVIRWGGEARSFTECNPEEAPNHPDRLWTLDSSEMSNLDWAPGDWKWRKLGALKEAPFFAYTSKRGYKQVLRKVGEIPIGVRILTEKGYTQRQIKQTFTLM